jgi:F-type H+-transporting ATPase subunit epsilon
MKMRLKVITPAKVCVDRKIARLVAEAPDGFFGILPHHIDFVTELVPGILVYEPEDTQVERFVAINSGTLVKCGDDVRVAVRGAIEGDVLSRLRERVETEFRRQDEDERIARSALTRLEATMIRRFRDLEKAHP